MKNSLCHLLETTISNRGSNSKLISQYKSDIYINMLNPSTYRITIYVKLIYNTLSNSEKMAPRKMKMRKKQITNDIHTYTYVHVSKVGKTAVEVGVSKLLMLSIPIIKRI